jgi:hypothetical protein
MVRDASLHDAPRHEAEQKLKRRAIYFRTALAFSQKATCYFAFS